MKLVYVAGPYMADTHEAIDENIAKAERYSIDFIRKGYAVITPHKNAAHYEEYGLPEEVYHKMDLEILSRCDILALTPRWSGSEHAIKEHDKAKEWGKEIWFL